MDTYALEQHWQPCKEGVESWAEILGVSFWKPLSATLLPPFYYNGPSRCVDDITSSDERRRNRNFASTFRLPPALAEVKGRANGVLPYEPHPTPPHPSGSTIQTRLDCSL